MPRFKDLLEYLAAPELEDKWVLLDIKVPWPSLIEPLKKKNKDEEIKLDNDADDLFRLIAATLADVKPSRPWNQRVLLGCWGVGFCTFYISSISDIVIGKIPSSLHQISTWISGDLHWVQLVLCAPIPQSTWR